MPQLIEKLSGSAAEVSAHFCDADHAFFNDTRPEVHNRGAADEAWTRSVAFLIKHLQ
ncbi:MAG: dienelactone hydrolase family protein [Gemmatimonadaceae bacterium]|nr:dienelactone hydrolase family protein [Gemmatimonadaceae bacterium]